ncbi:MAG: alpha/beta hydrolase family protein [Candidatus Sumerlaeota bacterium]
MRHEKRIETFLNDLFCPDLRRDAFSGSSKADFLDWSERVRPVLQDLIGLGRIREDIGRFAPSVSLEEAEDIGDYWRQKGLLHSEPFFDVPFWYLKPKGPGPFPIALFPHGHYAANGLDYAAGVAASVEMQRKIEEEDRDVAVQAVRRGFAAIAPATRGFSPVSIPDISSRHGKSQCRSHFMHSLLAGRTAVGERVWDLQRLLDWAIEQPDSDTSSVLMMGNSGGGVTALYAAACDERITTAVASCSFCTFVGENGVLHHCDCNAVPGILRFGEFHDVAGLIAHRRLLLVHGRTDALFPLEEVERAVDGVRKIFHAADAAPALAHEYGAGGHRFYSDLMWPFVMQVS